MTTTLVGLLGARDAPDGQFVSFRKVLRLLDPSGEDERLYLVATESTSPPTRTCSDDAAAPPPPPKTSTRLYELVRVLSDEDDYDWSGDGSDGGYTSLFVGNVVVNRPLHTFTAVDPLFWVLSKFDPPPALSSSSSSSSSSSNKNRNEQQQQNKWQPLHQIVAGMNLALPESIVEELLRLRPAANAGGSAARRFRPVDHLFQRMDLGGPSEEGDDANEGCDEDEVFYKFCPERALAWLRRKQHAVETVMKLIAVEHIKRGGGEDGNKNHGNAFDAGFCFGDDDPSTDNAENCNSGANTSAAKDPAVTGGDPSKSDADSMLDNSSLQRVKDESVQVVCQYLSDSWRDALLRSMELSRSNLEGTSASPPASKSLKVGTGTTSSGGLPTPHLSIEEQLLGVGVSETNKKQQPPVLSNKKPKIKPSDVRGVKKMTSFFMKK